MQHFSVKKLANSNLMQAYIESLIWFDQDQVTSGIGIEGCVDMPKADQGGGMREGVSHSQKIRDYFILKWHILMHI